MSKSQSKRFDTGLSPSSQMASAEGFHTTVSNCTKLTVTESHGP